MRHADRQVAQSVADQLRNQARQAGWANDPAAWAHDVLGVHMWSKQKEIAQSVIDNKRTIVASCHGTGKALHHATPIPTPTGTIAMGDITPGMQVLGSDGNPVTVVATTGIHTAPSYRLHLQSPYGRTQVIASGDHLWPVLSSRDQAKIKVHCERADLDDVHWGLWHHRAENLTTHQLYRLMCDRQKQNLLLPPQVPQLPALPLPRDATYLRSLFTERGGTDLYGRPCLTWLTGLCTLPPAALTQARDRLASSGLHTTLRKERNRTSLTWTLSLPPSKTAALLPQPDRRAIARTRTLSDLGELSGEGWRLLDVEKVGDQEVQCIQVDAPDHLYLCSEERIPTHNSMIASVISCWWICTRPLGEAVVVSCYTDDTEVLTREGWKLFKDVKTGPRGDEFATRNPETKEFEWQPAFRYWEEPWDGEIVDIKGRSTDLRVTPNHRMVVQWSTHDKGVQITGETFKRADAIGPTGAELPARSVWRGRTPETVTFGQYTWDAVDFAAFLGAYLAAGSLCIDGRRADKRDTDVALKVKGDESYRDLLIRMLGQEPRTASGEWRWPGEELRHYLEALGRDHEKYIPKDVKNWGPEALEKLLEFYLLGQDSQGERAAEGDGSWRACTVSKRLADDLQEVAQKVGGHATIAERAPHEGGVFEGGRRALKEDRRNRYDVVFGECQTQQIKATRSHYTGNVYCVSVPNETLYVRRGGAPIWCANTAPTYPQVNKILWEEIRKHHATARRRGRPMPGKVTQSDEWKSDDGQVLAFGRKPADGDRHGFQGIHRRFVLAVGDEACGLPEEIWTGIEAITTGDYCRILYIGNPDDRNTEFGKNYLDPKTANDWNRISVPASSTPNFTGEKVPPLLNEVLVSKAWAEERRRAWGDDDARYIAKVLARFPEASQSSLFPPALIASAFDEIPEQPIGSVVKLGVDVARFGTDENVVISYAGRTARIERVWGGTDTVSSAHQVLKIAEECRDRLRSPWVEIRVDAVGLGAGVVDTLNARAVLEERPWFSVYEMHGSAAPPVNLGGSVHGYGNARAYWFDQLRQMMRNTSVRVEDNQQLKDDLGVVFYQFRNGRLFIIPKEEMRKKHGRSPDYADALAYATAPVAEGLEEGSTVSEDANRMLEALEEYDDSQGLSISPF